MALRPSVLIRDQRAEALTPGPLGRVPFRRLTLGARRANPQRRGSTAPKQDIASMLQPPATTLCTAVAGEPMSTSRSVAFSSLARATERRSANTCPARTPRFLAARRRADDKNLIIASLPARLEKPQEIWPESGSRATVTVCNSERRCSHR